MKTLSYYFISAFIIIIFISSCKKKDQEPTPSPIVSYLCTGKGSASFYPMAINNEWSYPGFFNTSKVVFIRRTKNFGVHTYFEIETNDGSGGQSYLREDTNGDIIGYNTSTEIESVVIPGAPVLNEEWHFSNGTSKKITSVNSTVVTNSCNYLNCIEITFKDQNGNITFVQYYKAGIGKVSYKTYPPPGLGNPIKWDLWAIVLN